MRTERPNGPPVTSTVEDYLQLIYKMVQEHRPVLASRLAERLGVSLPTVLGTLQRMTRDGLVESDEKRQIALTARGLGLAESMVRRQRLAERFLVDVLGLYWAEANVEAHLLEHAISPKVEARLNAMLRSPATCPHGNPIPGNGAEAPRDLVTVASGQPGEIFVVDRLAEDAEGDGEFLEWLQRHGVMPGRRLTVVEHERVAGTVVLEGDQGRVTFGLSAAERVYGRREASGRAAGDGAARGRNREHERRA
ncbi:MAG TPA: metal-dependent transcriptional regulator [Thermodesulfobacteriota bacterium]